MKNILEKKDDILLKTYIFDNQDNYIDFMNNNDISVNLKMSNLAANFIYPRTLIENIYKISFTGIKKQI
jgi:hypothetical protein